MGCIASELAMLWRFFSTAFVRVMDMGYVLACWAFFVGIAFLMMKNHSGIVVVWVFLFFCDFVVFLWS